jgi:hypothetical protein
VALAGGKLYEVLAEKELEVLKGEKPAPGVK